MTELLADELCRTILSFLVFVAAVFLIAPLFAAAIDKLIYRLLSGSWEEE